MHRIHRNQEQDESVLALFVYNGRSSVIPSFLPSCVFVCRRSICPSRTSIFFSCSLALELFDGRCLRSALHRRRLSRLADVSLLRFANNGLVPSKQASSGTTYSRGRYEDRLNERYARRGVATYKAERTAHAQCCRYRFACHFVLSSQAAFLVLSESWFSFVLISLATLPYLFLAVAALYRLCLLVGDVLPILGFSVLILRVAQAVAFTRMRGAVVSIAGRATLTGVSCYCASFPPDSFSGILRDGCVRSVGMRVGIKVAGSASSCKWQSPSLSLIRKKIQQSGVL